MPGLDSAWSLLISPSGLVDLGQQLFADLLGLAFLRNTATALAISAYFPHLLHLDAISDVLCKAVCTELAFKAEFIVPGIKRSEDDPVARTTR